MRLCLARVERRVDVDQLEGLVLEARQHLKFVAVATPVSPSTPPLTWMGDVGLATASASYAEPDDAALLPG